MSNNNYNIDKRCVLIRLVITTIVYAIALGKPYIHTHTHHYQCTEQYNLLKLAMSNNYNIDKRCVLIWLVTTTY